MNMHIRELRHPKAGVPVQTYTYRDPHGVPVLLACRFERRDGGKFYLPYDTHRMDWKAPDKRPIYNLDKINGADPTQPIILAEGEKCADALCELGYLATATFGGCKALGKTDLSPLQDRSVIIWPDHDEPGQAYALDAARELTSQYRANVTVIPINELELNRIFPRNPDTPYSKGWDVADAVRDGWEKPQIDALIAQAIPHGRSYENREKSAHSSLETMKFWHSSQREAFVTLQKDGHSENWPIKSSEFGDYLAHLHYQETGKMLTKSALEDKRSMLIGQALFKGAERKIFTRIGEIDHSIYIDLGDKDWNSIQINASGWTIGTDNPAHFQRARSMQALPLPVTGAGDINLLRPFLNTASETDFIMLIAWVLGCFHPRGPHPILILAGEQGSAKSTTAKVLRSLIDPSNPSARSAPTSERDLVIAAKHNHVLSYDNLSYIKADLADALCRMATGGGFGTRKLHSDSEEVLFTATRPCLLNGIPDLANRPDLADRSIIVTLPSIPTTERRSEAEYWREFQTALPRIFAGFLDAVSGACANLGSVNLTHSPRMADFAKWITAAQPALGWQPETFMSAYSANQQAVEDAAIENNPVAEAILCLINDQGEWSGTATELIKTLRTRYPILTDDPISFPRQPNKLSSALKRIIPLLRRRNVIITKDRRGPSGQRLLTIKQANLSS